MSKTSNYKNYWKITVLVLFVISVSIFHYMTGTTHKHHGLHEIYRRLYYVPIILSAFWFGLKGGLFCGDNCKFFLSASCYLSVGVQLFH